MSREGIIVIDDVLPDDPLQARRERQTRTWCGDVWRIVPTLKAVRHDLKITLLDTAPSGLMIVRDLDPSNRRLYNSYNKIVGGLMRR